jgi:hypothetical protein
MALDIGKVVTDSTNAAVNKGVGQVVNQFNTSVHTNVAKFVNGGSKQILNSINAPPLVREAVRNISAPIVQAAVTSAGNIFQGILDGVFNTGTVKKFESLQVLKHAVSADDLFAKDMMNLNVLAGVAGNITSKPEEILLDNTSSPFADDIANMFPPKFKFLFLVEFIFNEPFNNQPVFSQSNFNTVIHKFDRPKIEIEHDDFNLYNFTTQVPKSVKYGPVTITAHDDVKGNTLAALVKYLRNISPIFNINASNGTSFEHEGGLNFKGAYQSSNFSSVQQGSGETRSYLDDVRTIIKEIRVYHVYDFGKYVDVYKYFNPKITSITMDDFNMSEGGQGNSVSFDFAYDGFYIDLQKTPQDVPIFESINFGVQYDMVNRNIAEGENKKAKQLEQVEEKKKAKASQLEIDKQILRENYEVIYNKDMSDGAIAARKSQSNIDAQIARENAEVMGTGPRRVNQGTKIASTTDYKVVESVMGFFKRR